MSDKNSLTSGQEYAIRQHREALNAMAFGLDPKAGARLRLAIDCLDSTLEPVEKPAVKPAPVVKAAGEIVDVNPAKREFKTLDK